MQTLNDKGIFLSLVPVSNILIVPIVMTHRYMFAFSKSLPNVYHSESLNWHLLGK